MSSNPNRPNPSQDRPNDEPEITQEESVPSDGKDEVGEKMMENLGRERGGPGTEDSRKKAA